LTFVSKSWVSIVENILISLIVTTFWFFFASFSFFAFSKKTSGVGVATQTRLSFAHCDV